MKKKYADMDPLEEIRAIRKDIMREFKTLDALCEHLNTMSSGAVASTEPASDDRNRTMTKQAKSSTPKTRKTSSGRRKTAVRPAHV